MSSILCVIVKNTRCVTTNTTRIRPYHHHHRQQQQQHQQQQLLVLVYHSDRYTCIREGTYFMEQSPSWEANRFSASQEIRRIVCNPKVYYRLYKSPPAVPILSQIYPIHVPILLLENPPTIYLTKTLYAHLLSPYVPHAPPISFFSIWSPD